VFLFSGTFTGWFKLMCFFCFVDCCNERTNERTNERASAGAEARRHGKKTVSLLGHFLYKNAIILPRQARDRHGLKHNKEPFSFRSLPTQTPPMVSKNGLFEPFICKNERFTKTGSGQT